MSHVYYDEAGNEVHRYDWPAPKTASIAGEAVSAAVRAEVDARVRRYVFDHGLDPVKDYRAAMEAVFALDPELKRAYWRS
jgi:hypothetical protein